MHHSPTASLPRSTKTTTLHLSTHQATTAPIHHGAKNKLVNSTFKLSIISFAFVFKNSNIFFIYMKASEQDRITLLSLLIDLVTLICTKDRSPISLELLFLIMDDLIMAIIYSDINVSVFFFKFFSISGFIGMNRSLSRKIDRSRSMLHFKIIF